MWAARADEDKARYLQELAEYVPPPGYDAKGDSVIQFPAAGRRKSKKERDPNAPKRAKSAYLYTKTPCVISFVPRIQA